MPDTPPTTDTTDEVQAAQEALLRRRRELGLTDDGHDPEDGPVQFGPVLARLRDDQPPPGLTVHVAPPDPEEVWLRIVPSRFTEAHRDPASPEVAALVDGWNLADNVLICGPVGTGKTHLAVRFARRAHDTQMSVLFVPVVELLDAMRPGGDPQATNRASQVDVLILDDLASERPTDWTGERLTMVVNHRWLNQRPTVATSNLTPAKLEEAVGERCYSRLYHGAVRFTLTGDDRRRHADGDT